MTRGPYWTESGTDWRLAYALDQCADEIDARWPEGAAPNGPSQRYLGTLGDRQPQHQNPFSGHFPAVLAPDGKLLVRAFDVNLGSDELNMQLARMVWDLYNNGFPPLRDKGYAHCNGFINPWDDDPNTVDSPDPGDDGHVHIEVTCSTYPAYGSSYQAACDSRQSWGIAGHTTEGGGTPLPTPTPPTSPAAMGDDMAMIITTAEIPGDRYLVTAGSVYLIPEENLARTVAAFGITQPSLKWPRASILGLVADLNAGKKTA